MDRKHKYLAARASSRSADADHGVVGRLLGAFVAVLFFAPVLCAAWWFGNVELALHGGNPLPGKLVTGAIAAAAALGFLLPRVTPTVFGWCAEGVVQAARWCFFPWR